MFVNRLKLKHVTCSDIWFGLRFGLRFELGLGLRLVLRIKIKVKDTEVRVKGTKAFN
jgi:hypothetical protein